MSLSWPQIVTRFSRASRVGDIPSRVLPLNTAPLGYKLTSSRRRNSTCGLLAIHVPLLLITVTVTRAMGGAQDPEGFDPVRFGDIKVGKYP